MIYPPRSQHQEDKERERRQIQEGLEPLFRSARANGLAFHCNYQDMWFMPDQLEKEQREGRFNWGACNWTLRNPQERVQQAENAVHSAKKNLESVRKWAESS